MDKLSVDVLVAERGSTTTLVNAFSLGDEPRWLGQGQAATTVEQGDVCLGMQAAAADLERRLGASIALSLLTQAMQAANGTELIQYEPV